MKFVLYTWDTKRCLPYTLESHFWRVRGVCRTAREAVKLRRKLEAEGYDREVSITYKIIDKG